ncbi:stationary phase or STEss regulating sigma factor [Yersinia rochesterensis]|uniref:stationary phase or STEss regulating sigma factor n=1 Tax=Yersinia rochesterensis TaxID=1604335 RepID=UPI001F3C530D|nr:stationary phase or STEss regulating sigma factor [Yersinia rochesterensis]
MEYFSDKEKGFVQITNNGVSMIVWTGLVSYINVLVCKGYFGKYFPEECPDGQGCIGTNEDTFKAALQAEIPNIGWPLGVGPEDVDLYGYRSRTQVTFIPDYLVVMDLLQFCYKHVAAPVESNDYHSYYRHTHIHDFDVDTGRNEFLEKVNVIFARNGMAYELQKSGEIIRLLSLELVQMMSSVNVPAEVELKKILARANAKIVNFDVQVRYDAVKELWDFWERLKSIHNPSNKKISAKQLLDDAAATPEFRNILEVEAKYLTVIGNEYFIRHAEMNQVKIQESDHIEYLYHRMFSLIHLLMKTFTH